MGASSGIASGSDSLLLFLSSSLLDSDVTTWLVEGSDWHLGHFDGWIVDIGATF